LGNFLALPSQLRSPSTLPHLTGIQSRILLVMFQSGREFVSNEDLMKSGIGHSAWSEEQKKLIELRLLEKSSLRVMRGKGICKTVNYKLTDRGRAVAFNLSCISKMISSPELSEKLNSQDLNGEDLESEIVESIEVALDSFGINLIPLVKSNMEAETHQWKDVLHRPQYLIAVLKDLFGQEGANTIESMIVDNLKSRFVFEMVNEKNLVCVVAELKRMNSARQLSQPIFEV
jgi:hypothetical protein